MKPESVLRLPLSQDCEDVVDRGEYIIAEARHSARDSSDTNAAALVAMCNAYPLALKLAEAVAPIMDRAHHQTECPSACPKQVPEKCYCGLSDARRALAAFLAHRTPAQHEEKGGGQ